MRSPLAGNTMAPWHEDDLFWETFAPGLFTRERWDAVPEEVDQIQNLLGISPGDSVLDLCCGPGRHSLELARRGFSVTGVDRTRLYLESAQRQAREEGLPLELLQEDMRRFRRDGAFDAALSLFTSFGYFSEQKDDEQVLQNLFSSLKPGGRLLIDLMGKEVNARTFRERDWHEREGILFLEERKVSQDWGWLDNRWITIKGMERKEFRLALRLYSATELRQILLDSGFPSVRVFGDLAGSPYDHKAKRLVVIAHKE